MRLLVALLLAGLAGATTCTNVTSASTSTQIQLRYLASDSGVCAIVVLDNSGLLTSVKDVDTTYFNNASSDTSRTAANGFKWPIQIQSNVNGSQWRTLVIGGHSEVKLAKDGITRISTALQCDTQHKITIGSTVVWVKTKNVPVANSYPEPPVVDATAPFDGNNQPTIDFSCRECVQIDPITGVLIKLATKSTDQIPTVFTLPSVYARDVNGGTWSIPQNPPDNTHLAFTNTPNAPLFIAWSWVYPSQYGPQGFFDASYTFIDRLVHLYGSETGGGVATVSLSTDSGQTAASDNSFDVVLSTSASNHDTPVTYPKNGYAEWGNSKSQLSAYLTANGFPLTGMSTSGHVVTNGVYGGGAPNLFPMRASGSKFKLSGCATAGTYTVDPSPGDNPLTLTALEVIGTGSNCTYQDLGAGIRILMKNTGGAPTISVAATSDVVTSGANGPPNTNASSDTCSPLKVSDIAKDCTGAPQSPNLTGRMCQLGNQIYLVQDNGKMCLQSSFYVTGLGVLGALHNPFSSVNAKTWSAVNTGNNDFYSVSKATTDYTEYSPGIGTPPQGDAVYTKTATAASIQSAVISNGGAAGSMLTTGLIGTMTINNSGVINGHAIWGAQLGGQDTPCIRATTDLNGNLQSVWDSWSTYPFRWGSCHFGPLGGDDYYQVGGKPPWAFNSTCAFCGPFQFQVLAIKRSGSFQQWTVPITGATNANPGVFTAVNNHLDQGAIHQFGSFKAIGPMVYVSGYTSGWTGANGTWLAIPTGGLAFGTFGTDADHFKLCNVSTLVCLDTSSFGASSGSPQFITAPPLHSLHIDAVSGTPALATLSLGYLNYNGQEPYTTKHDLQDGDPISFSGLNDATQYYAKVSCGSCNATHIQVYTDAGLTTGASAASLAGAVNGFGYFAEACPAAIPTTFTTLFDKGPYNPAIRCVTVLVNGDPCSYYGDTERAYTPDGGATHPFNCPSDTSNTSKSGWQSVIVGDSLIDPQQRDGDHFNGENLLVVKKVVNSASCTPPSITSCGIELTLMRWNGNSLSNPEGHAGISYFNEHEVGWNALVTAPLITRGSNMTGYSNANTGVAQAIDPAYAGTHADIGHGATPGNISYEAGFNYSNHLPNITFASFLTTPFIFTQKHLSYFQGTDATTAYVGFESYPGKRQDSSAPAREQVWGTDWINANPPSGNVNSWPSLLYAPNNYTNIRGTTYDLGNTTNYVWKVPLAPSTTTVDLKRVPLLVDATRMVYQDKSGPGSVISDSDIGFSCVAVVAGQCRTNSLAGDVFVAGKYYYPFAGCYSNVLTFGTPCAFPLSPFVNGAIQMRTDPPNYDGTGHRRLTTMYTAPAQPYSFQTWYPMPDAVWAFVSAPNINGSGMEMWRFKIPSWPAGDTINRTQYIKHTLKFTGKSGDTIQVGYGYAENGTPAQLYCTQYNDSCWSSSGSSYAVPFQFSTESQSPTTCNSTCTVDIYGISQRILYYVVKRVNGSSTLISEVRSLVEP